MKLLPQTAFARIALLIALVLCVTTVAAGFVFGRFAQQQWVDRLAGRIANELERSHSVLDRQGQGGAEGGGDESSGVRIVPRPPGPLRRGRLARGLERLLSAEIGEPVRVGISHHERAIVWVNSASRPDYWVGVPFGRGWMGPVGRLLLWLAVVGVAVFVGAYFLARQFTRPLESLVRITDAIGRGEVPPSVEERGPRELRKLRRALYRAASDQREMTRVREQMLAGVSHDLRTPMSRLRIATEILGDSASDSALSQGMIADIEEMDRIIEQFLAWVRDGQDESPENLAFDELVADCVTRFSGAGQAVTFVPGGVGTWLVRPLAMWRLVSNLLSNAATHGQGPIEVATRVERGVLVLTVADHGPGIPVDRRRELLEPFVTSQRSRSEGGAGLGLAIVDRVAKLHGGDVKFSFGEGRFEVMVTIAPGAVAEEGGGAVNLAGARP